MSVSEKLGLGPEVRQLKIGQSFLNSKTSAFHTLKYDFKPASVDTNKIASVDVGKNNQVTVTVPHLDGAGVPQTVFKGSQRLYQKECVLIIDRVTGEITLEKLACNLQVKKTRTESAKLPMNYDRLSSNDRLSVPSSTTLNSSNLSTTTTTPSITTTPPPPPNNNSPMSVSSSTQRSQTPPIGQRISHKTKVTSGSRRGNDRQITHLVPKHSPLHASPNYPSPSNNRSPKNEAPNNPSMLASLPMIGFDDFPEPVSRSADKSPPLPSPPPPPPSQLSQPAFSSNNNHSNSNNNHYNKNGDRRGDEVGEITDSSSSSSDSDSDTDPDNIEIGKRLPKLTNGHHTNGYGGASLTPPIQHQHTSPPLPVLTPQPSTNTSNNSTTSSQPSKLPTHLLNDDLCLSESGSSDSE